MVGFGSGLASEGQSLLHFFWHRSTQIITDEWKDCREGVELIPLGRGY